LTPEVATVQLRASFRIHEDHERKWSVKDDYRVCRR
jgi:hypothetical protein